MGSPGVECYGEDCPPSASPPLVSLHPLQASTPLALLLNGTDAGNESDVDTGEGSDLSHDAKIGLIVLYTLTTMLSLGGNIVVVIVFSRGRRCRTDIRPFLVNLAVADLIMGVFCMPFTFSFVMMKTWVFSAPMCPIVLFFQHLSVSCSVFTNMAIGIDRFLVVTFPLRSRVTTARAKYVLLTIWISALSLSSVQLAVGRAQETHPNATTLTCDEVWPSSHQRRIFTLFVLVITYIIPLLILSVTYSIVGILLWKRTAPGNADQTRDLHQLRAKRKVVKMLVLVVCMFGVCWLPLHTFFLVLDFHPYVYTPARMHLLTGLYYAVHWLAMSNSFANPIIYGFTNDSFRIDLVHICYNWFPFCKCLQKLATRKLSVSTYETNLPNRMRSTVRRPVTQQTALKQASLKNGHKVYFELKRSSSKEDEDSYRQVRQELCGSGERGDEV